jgi:hypothetical protein
MTHSSKMAFSKSFVMNLKQLHMLCLPNRKLPRHKPAARIVLLYISDSTFQISSQ